MTIRACRRRRTSAWPEAPFWPTLSSHWPVSPGLRALGGLGLGRRFCWLSLALRRRLCRLARPGNGLALALGEQFQRLGERNGVRRGSLWDGGVHLAPIDISAETPVAHCDRPAVRVLAHQTADHAAARRLGFEQFHCVIEGEARRVGPLGQGGVDLAVSDIRSEPALLDADRAALRMLAENAGRAAAKPRAASPALLRDDEIDRPVAADLQHIVVAAEVGVGLAMLHVGAVAADAGEDRLAARRMARHLPRQGEQR